MYSYLKQLLRKIIPGKLIFKYEPVLRGILYLFYKGSNFRCNICSKKLRKFIEIPNTDKLCPNCGSSSRDRRLWQVLDSEFLKIRTEILDFSPSRSIYRKLKKTPFISYTSTDLSGDFISEKSFNITDINIGSESYDLIICYHVLEHIENDSRAMKELYRVLRKNGTCIIQTPFKDGKIYENPSLKTEEERLKYFGQKDHVRIYSVSGLKERLSNCGFEVDVRKFIEEINNYTGFVENETILICHKLSNV